MPGRAADPSHPEVSLEELLGTLLRIGVSVAAGIVAIGAAIYLARHGAEPRGFRVFHGEPPEFRTIPGMLKEIGGLSGRGVIELGLLCLVATPVARVVFAAVGFATLRDRTYVAICLVVLAVLLASLFGSAHIAM